MKMGCSLLMLCVLLLCACGENKEVYLNGFSKFVDQVREEGHTYTEVDWERSHKHHDEFVRILNQRFGKKLTESDRVTISKLKGTYAALKIKNEVRKMQEILEAENQNILTSDSIASEEISWDEAYRESE